MVFWHLAVDPQRHRKVGQNRNKNSLDLLGASGGESLVDGVFLKSKELDPNNSNVGKRQNKSPKSADYWQSDINCIRKPPE
jgi:hypothetical protein